MKIYLPSEIELPAISNTVTLTYKNEPTLFLDVKLEPNQIKFIGQITNEAQIYFFIEKWLKKKARETLLPWLNKLSLATHLKFQKVQIRNQNTRWGSCSSMHHISLNCKLLFLPAPLVEHILLHELCHTIYFNHSKDFWNLLKQFDGNFIDNKTSLKHAHLLIPKWVNYL